MTRLYMICDQLGNALADNVREDYARDVAHTIANISGKTVWLWDRSASPNDLGEAVTVHRPWAALQASERGYQAGRRNAMKAEIDLDGGIIGPTF